MQLALDLAWRGWGRVHPNPLVGAVVLRDGDIAGRGYHAEFGGPHAEVVALNEAGTAARGATIVVTLEPCAHTGKQPPCTDAIITAGIRHVVFAVPDPDPRAAGGARLLENAGISIRSGVKAESAERQNALFLGATRNPERPFVAVKLATSVDAKIADHAGRSRWISGTEARDWVHWLRAGFDALAVGAGTALADDPSLTVRGPVQPRTPPGRIVFGRPQGLPSTLKLFQAPSAEIVDHTGAPMSVILERLRSRGIHSLLVEGGGRLVGRLLAEDLVDRLYWIQAPLWLGQEGRPAFAGLDVPGGLGTVVRWEVAERRSLGEDTLLVLDRRGCLPAS